LLKTFLKTGWQTFFTSLAQAFRLPLAHTLLHPFRVAGRITLGVALFVRLASAMFEFGFDLHGRLLQRIGRRFVLLGSHIKSRHFPTPPCRVPRMVKNLDLAVEASAPPIGGALVSGWKRPRLNSS